MNKKYLFISLILLIISGVVSCKDVLNDVPDTPSGTTPYIIQNNDTLLPPNRIPTDNPLTVEGVQLGRMLFYDPILSADSTISCSTCHDQKDAFTHNGKRVSAGVRGLEGTRNSMPIFNLMWHLDGFFWDGRSELLRHQALAPIEDPLEMDETLGNVISKLNRSEIYADQLKTAFDADEWDEDIVGKALEQFMLSIISANSKFDRAQLGIETLTPQELLGQIIFNSEATPLRMETNPNTPLNFGGDCFHCHGGSLFMRREYLSNGLPEGTVDDKGRGGANSNPLEDYLFKTPTLRNIELTAPYMHDGRFNTLEEVVQHYLSPLDDSQVDLSNSPNMHALRDSVYLSEEHKAALIAFMKTLTDESLLVDERYSNPFK